MKKAFAVVGGVVAAGALALCAPAFGSHGGGGGGHGGGFGGHGGFGVHGGGGGWGGWHGGGWGGWHGRGGYFGCCGWGLGFYDPFWDPYLWYGYDWGPVDLPYDYAAPPVGTNVPPPPSYWFYCPDTRSYYPYVQQCASAWQKIPAAAPH